MSNVFIAFQDNEDARPIIEAILADNPAAQATYPTGLVKIDAPGRLVVRRATIEELVGAPLRLAADSRQPCHPVGVTLTKMTTSFL
jgi:phenol hydroxylase P2 protein